MTTITPIKGGTCIRVRMKDEENELDLHCHKDGLGSHIISLTARSAQLGPVYELKAPFAEQECEER